MDKPQTQPKTGEQRESQQEFNLERLQEVGRHWREFFDEIGTHIVEREDLIAQIEHAVATGRHVAVLGLPGTAKTTLARMILGRIVKEDGSPSLFAKQLTGETRAGEITGQQMPVHDARTGHITGYRRAIERGIKDFDFALFDEGFDAPVEVLRGVLLGILLEKKFLDGEVEHPVALKTAILTSNKSLETLIDRFQGDADAVLDRFLGVFWTPRRIFGGENVDRQILRKALERKITEEEGAVQGLRTTPLKLGELDVIQSAISYVRRLMAKDADIDALVSRFYRAYQAEIDKREPDFGRRGKRSKIESGRSMTALITDMLPAIAVIRHMRNPQTPLRVIPEDFEKLKLFLMMRMPKVANPDATEFGSDEDKEVYQRFAQEDEAFDKTYQGVVAPEIHRQERLKPNAAEQTALKTAVEAWEAAAQTDQIQASRDILTDDTARKLQRLEETARLMADSVDLYNRALTAYIKALTTLLASGAEADTALAKQKFQEEAAPRLQGERRFILSPAVQTAVSDFRTALRAAHQSKIGSNQTMEDFIRQMDQITAEAAMLGAEAIPALQDAVRQACFARAAAAEYLNQISQALPELNAQLNELKKLAELLSQLKHDQNLRTASAPSERLIELQTKMLNLTLTMLRRAYDLLQANIGNETEREQIMTFMQNIIQLYLTQITVISADQVIPDQARFIPQAEIQQRLEALRAAKESSLPQDSRVEAEICPSEEEQKTGGLARTATARLKTISAIETNLDVDSVKKQYKLYLLDNRLNQDEILLALPAFAPMVRQVLAAIKNAFGETFAAKREADIKAGLAELIRSAVRQGSRAVYICPFTVKGVKLRPIRIADADIIQQAVADYETRALADDELLRAFIEDLDYAPTQTNLAAFRTILTAPTDEIQRVRLDTPQKDETITIQLRDIAEELCQGAMGQWRTVQGEIDACAADAGRAFGHQIAQETLGISAGLTPSTGPITLPDLERKYAGVFGQGVTPAAKKDLQEKWPQVPLQFPDTDQATKVVFKQNLRTYISGLPINPDMSLGESFANELMNMLAFLQTHNLPREEYLPDIKDLIEAKIKEWGKLFVEKIRQTRTAIASIPTTDRTIGRFTQIFSTTRYLSSPAFKADNIAVLQSAAQEFGIDQTTVDGLIESIAKERIAALLDITDAFTAAAETLEIPELNFSMDDIAGTLTSANVKEVKERLAQYKLFGEKAQMLTRMTEKEMELHKGYVEQFQRERLAQISTRLTDRKKAFLEKVADIEMAGTTV